MALAFEAAKKELVNVDEWLWEKVNSAGNGFISALLKFLKDRVFEPLRTSEAGQYTAVLEKSKLSLDLLTKLLRLVMEQSSENISQKNKLASTDLYKELLGFFPEVEAKAAPMGVDVTANSMIEKVFEGSLAVPDFVKRRFSVK